MKPIGTAARRSSVWLAILMSPVFFVAVSLNTSAFAAPQKLEKARAGDCAACHGADKVLPQSHAPTAEMTGEACLGCHQPGSPLALRTKMPLSHLHQLKGVTCKQCHGDKKAPQALSMEQCLACHGSVDKVAARTAKAKPNNPHASPHGKTYIACDLCHHQHAKSENFCAQCHDFKFAVP